MESVIFDMNEVVSRKDYLKSKEKKKKKQSKNKMPPYFLILFITVLTCYVVFQFETYKNKYRLINTVPEEISSLKDYDIYYTTKTYTYNPEIVLNYTKSNDTSKEEVPSAIGITKITGKNGYLYGIKDGKLVRVKNIKGNRSDVSSNFSVLEIIIEKGVQSYTVYKEEVYAFSKGKGIDTGIYAKSKESNKYIKIIGGDISQILVDENNIFVVESGTNKNIYSYSKDGKNKREITRDRAVTYMIEDKNVIYFADGNKDGNIYSINKYSGEEKNITKLGAIKIANDKDHSDGNFCMGIADGHIYYINGNKDNNLFEANIDGTFGDKKVIASSIEKISIVGHSVIYKEKNVPSIYRYEVKNEISSEVTNGRIIDFSASAVVK